MMETTEQTTSHLSKEFQFILQKMAPILGRIEPFLREFRSGEERTAFVSSQLDSYHLPFMNFIDTMRKSKEPISILTGCQLYGSINSYDLLVTIHITESITEKSFTWDETTGKPEVSPGDLIPLAIQSRTTVGDDSRYALQAFTSGLVFDLLNYWNTKQGVNVKATETIIQTLYESAINTTKLALKEGKKAERLELEKQLISVIMLKMSGRIIFSILNKTYADYGSAMEKNEFRSPFGHLLEKDVFSISNNMISCLLCKFIPGIQHISPALLFYDYPFMLYDRVTRTDLYDLVNFCVDLQANQQKDKKEKST